MSEGWRLQVGGHEMRVVDGSIRQADPDAVNALLDAFEQGEPVELQGEAAYLATIGGLRQDEFGDLHVEGVRFRWPATPPRSRRMSDETQNTA